MVLKGEIELASLDNTPRPFVKDSIDQYVLRLPTTVVTIDHLMRFLVVLWMNCRLLLDILVHVGIGGDVDIVTRECLKKNERKIKSCR